MWACGFGSDGQLGFNDEADRHVFERVGAGAFGGARVVAAAAGLQHSAAVTEDGALWTWGFGDDGRAGPRRRGALLGAAMVVGAGLGGGRIGRCRGLPAGHALAFAMGTHRQVGGGGHTGGAGAAAGGARRSSRLPQKAASPIFRLKEELAGMILGLSGRGRRGVRDARSLSLSLSSPLMRPRALSFHLSFLQDGRPPTHYRDRESSPERTLVCTQKRHRSDATGGGEFEVIDPVSLLGLLVSPSHHHRPRVLGFNTKLQQPPWSRATRTPTFRNPHR